MSRLWHWGFLVCLPIGIALLAAGQAVARVLISVGTPLLWFFRNTSWDRRTVVEAHTEDQMVMSQEVWMTARILASNYVSPRRPRRLLPYADDIAARLGRPGEKFCEGLGTVNWIKYQEGIRDANRVQAITRASQHLYLTSQRLLILLGAGRMFEIPLVKIVQVDAVVPPGTMEATDEGMIRLIHGDLGKAMVGWVARPADVLGFVEQVRENVSEYGGRQDVPHPSRQRGDSAP